MRLSLLKETELLMLVSDILSAPTSTITAQQSIDLEAINEELLMRGIEDVVAFKEIGTKVIRFHDFPERRV
jgi:hypothetical protein